MSILYDEAQQSIANESRRVLEARLNKDDLLPLLGSTGQYHEAFWTTAKEQGWTALALPEAHDGLALGLVELGLIAHQAGRSLSGAPFLTSSFGAAKGRNSNLVLAVGDRVSHDKYGLGTVLESTGAGVKAMVLIDFGSAGRVKMMLIGGVPMTKL